MRSDYQPVRFPGNLDDDAVLRELDRLESSQARLPLNAVNLRNFAGLLHAPILELDRIVRCVERDPLLAVGVLRLVTDELDGIDPIRISDCIVIAGRNRLLALAESGGFALASVPVLDNLAARSRICSLIASRLAASTRAADFAAARLAGLLYLLGELPILLSGRAPESYSPVKIAGWGKRLASSWRLPAALISAIAAYDMRVCDGMPDPMQPIIDTTRRVVSCHVLVEAPPAAVLLGQEQRASETAKCHSLS